MYKKILSLLLASVMCFAINVNVFADDYVFTDRNGNTQTVPDGEYSFATRVVDFTHGNPWTKAETRQKTESVLGEPDQDSDNTSHSLTLGVGGVLTVEFNVQITDGVGDNKFAPSNTTTEEEATGYANATREQALLIAVRMVENLK